MRSGDCYYESTEDKNYAPEILIPAFSSYYRLFSLEILQNFVSYQDYLKIFVKKMSKFDGRTFELISHSVMKSCLKVSRNARIFVINVPGRIFGNQCTWEYTSRCSALPGAMRRARAEHRTEES